MDFEFDCETWSGDAVTFGAWHGDNTRFWKDEDGHIVVTQLVKEFCADVVMYLCVPYSKDLVSLRDEIADSGRWEHIPPEYPPFHTTVIDEEAINLWREKYSAYISPSQFSGFILLHTASGKPCNEEIKDTLVNLSNIVRVETIEVFPTNSFCDEYLINPEYSIAEQLEKKRKERLSRFTVIK
jgi:hypothetical protein